ILARRGSAHLPEGDGGRRGLMPIERTRSRPIRIWRSAALAALHAVLLAAAWPGTAFATRLFIKNHVNSNQIVGLAAWQGRLVADDIRAFQMVGDTIWCATSAGLSAFAGGTWLNRAAALGVPVRDLELHADTLWASTVAGPRRYAAGVFTTVAAGHAGESIALH